MISPEQKHKNLVLHAVLLLRTVNRYQSKEEQMEEYDKYLTDEQLEDYIEHFNDPEPEINYEELESENMEYWEDEYYTPSCTAGDYSPSNPWNAPGMSIRDFI